METGFAVSGNGGESMTPFEILSIVLDFLGIITPVFIAFILLAHEKSDHEK
ncbi:hypothetical protein [uncultured Dubosiella sp.]|uniref:hypothetical protein n=1 Tax=uncultured Dubosiella sp. TaxID=1937011 RepID=UPI0025B34E46|nr:hypothetical protein [uncultured Dubosiella sp.]